MARGIRLTRSNLVNVSYQFVGAYRIRIEVAETTGGMPAEVFLYRRDPYNPITGEQLDIFLAIAGPADIADYPAFEPNGETEFPFFRLSYVELDVRATAVAEQIWTTVQRELNVLAEALDRMDQLAATETVWVGAQPPEGSQGGSSSQGMSQSVSEGAGTSYLSPRHLLVSPSVLNYNYLFGIEDPEDQE